MKALSKKLAGASKSLGPRHSIEADPEKSAHGKIVLKREPCITPHIYIYIHISYNVWPQTVQHVMSEQ